MASKGTEGMMDSTSRPLGWDGEFSLYIPQLLLALVMLLVIPGQ